MLGPSVNRQGPPCGQMQTTDRRAVRLEQLTIAWNSVEALVAVVAGVIAGSVALVGFGLDSVIEVFSASVVLSELRGVARERERRAMRLIGLSFLALALYVVIEAGRDLVIRARPEHS